MAVRYPSDLTMHAARAQYFADNGFGADGGYAASWVDFSLGPFPFPFPNTSQRVKAVGYHDLHHILTGYETSFTGELEISAWELGAGCGSFAAAWVLNLGGVAAGLFVAPRAVFAAFRRGRQSRSLYGSALEPLLDRTVGDVKAERCDVRAPAPALVDAACFAAVASVGLVVGTTLLAVLLPLLPLGLVTTRMRKAAERAATADARPSVPAQGA